MKHVVICDEHRIFGESLAFVLRTRGYEVVACTSGPDDALVAVAAHAPDLCITDLRFSRGDGLSMLRAMSRFFPSTRVIVVTGVGDLAAAVKGAVDAGASGVVSKSRPIDQVLDAVEIVGLGGESFEALKAEPRVDPWGSGPAELHRFLTPREREVFDRLSEGQSSVTIADEMAIAYSTVRTHIQNVLNKLGVHSKLEAVALVHGAEASHGFAGTGSL